MPLGIVSPLVARLWRAMSVSEGWKAPGKVMSRKKKTAFLPLFKTDFFRGTMSNFDGF